MPNSDHWRDRAQCANENPTIFFDTQYADVALSICQTCVVQSECLHDALLYNDHGIFGGMTEEDRAKLVLPTRVGDVRILVEYY